MGKGGMWGRPAESATIKTNKNPRGQAEGESISNSQEKEEVLSNSNSFSILSGFVFFVLFRIHRGLKNSLKHIPTTPTLSETKKKKMAFEKIKVANPIVEMDGEIFLLYFVLLSDVIVYMSSSLYLCLASHFLLLLIRV